jgi:hypothetical protein
MWKRIDLVEPVLKCPWCGRFAKDAGVAGPTKILHCTGCGKFFGVLEVMSEPDTKDIFGPEKTSVSPSKEPKNVTK